MYSRATGHGRASGRDTQRGQYDSEGKGLLVPWQLGVVYVPTASARVGLTTNLRLHGRSRDNQKTSSW